MLVRYADIHFLVRSYRTGDMKLFKRFVYHSEPVQCAFWVSSVYYAVFTAVKRKLQLFRHHLHPPDHSGTSAAAGADQTSGSLFSCKTAGCIIQTDSSLHCNDNRWMPAYP